MKNPTRSNLQLYFFLFTFSFLLLTSQSVFAADFIADYTVSYAVDETGRLSALQNITLTNQTGTLYPSDFVIELQAEAPDEITDIQAVSDDKPLKTDSTFDAGQLKIRVFFNQKVIGLGKKLQFTLSYTASNWAKKHGRIWEVMLPKIADADRIGQYRLELKLPPNFVAQNQKNSYLFKKEDFANGFTLQFGDYQVFDLTLKYHLQNPASRLALFEIALPPDLENYQTVYFRDLKPKPESVKVDQDGNYLAVYKLDPREKQTIVFEGQAKVLRQSLAESERQRAKDSYQQYLLPAKFWEVNDPAISERITTIASESNWSESTTDLEKAHNLYQFVIAFLEYDPARISDQTERLGAAAVLKNPQSAVCMEFTDLLITLLRASGIPSRELDGFANDVLHTWVQIYTPATGWFPADPTWGNTSGADFFNQFDFNHLTFVIKGLDSEKPQPAGTYKIDGSEKGDVEVKFATKIDPGLKPLKGWMEEFDHQKQEWRRTMSFLSAGILLLALILAGMALFRLKKIIIH